jgi:selenocysteine lyase/cysteine desulfurase
MTRPKKNFAVRLIVSLVLIVFLVRTGPALQSAQKKSPDDIQNPKPADIARDERFWIPIQEAFDIDRSIINLNNGGAHPAPRIAMNALHRYLDFANGAPTINSWGFIRPRKERLRQEIAALFGCSPEEIAITRNVTEALEIAELGIDLKPGDEVLTTTHDYPSMKNALLQREKRDGIVVKMFSFPYPPKNKKELADLFEQNVTPKTKMILCCHITNTTGQIFPIKDICQMARKRGIDVVIDGAHAFGQFDFKQKDLDCDIYGANLHKWIGAPIGTGFLYVKKEKIKKIWPLFAAPDPLSDDIRKFENYGTHPEPIWAAASEALAFQTMIGAKNKEERLRYLREYWCRAIEKLPGVKILTSYDPEQSCGIGTFTVDNMDIGKLASALADRHKIYVTTLALPDNVRAIRVTPSVYTTLHELDVFIEAVAVFVKNGLPQ